MTPKLVAEDLPVFRTLLTGVFPGVDIYSLGEEELSKHICDICKERNLVISDQWVKKALELYQVYYYYFIILLYCYIVILL